MKTPLIGATLINPGNDAPKDRPDDLSRPLRRFTPAHNWIEVERVRGRNDLSAGGVVLPEQEPWEARVIAVGPGLVTLNGDHVPMPCAVGDYIVATNFGSVWYDGYTHWMVKGDNVIAVVEPPRDTN